MPTYSMDHDEEYWQAPPAYAPMVEEANRRGDTRLSFFAMGDPDVNETPICAVLELPPGYIITRHAHPSERFEMVVRGSINDGDRDLVAGDVMTAGPGELYGPKVVGPDGCTTVEIFATGEGARGRIEELANGELTTIDLVELFAAQSKA